MMDSLFSADWRDRDDLREYEGETHAATMAELGIRYHGISLSTNEQVLDQTPSVRDRAFLSVYPLAVWLSWNFYRLAYEPLPQGNIPHLSWACAHDMSNAGDGYVWPPIQIYSDGIRTVLRPRVLEIPSHDPIRYTSSIPVVMPLDEFKMNVLQFLHLCADRLSWKGMESTEFQQIYHDLQDDLHDQEFSTWRKVEAMMGYDPDEAPDRLRKSFPSLFSFLGNDGIEELAANGPNSLVDSRQIQDWMLTEGVDRVVGDAASAPPVDPDPGKPAWVLAINAATHARHAWGLGSDMVENRKLAEIYGISPGALKGRTGTSPIPVSIYSRQDRRVVLNKNPESSRRFAIARLIGDDSLRHADNRFAVVSNSRTYRQKFQRAFAAELLCPREEVLGYFDNHPEDEESIQELAVRFGVSEMVIRHTLENSRGLECQEPLDRAM